MQLWKITTNPQKRNSMHYIAEFSEYNYGKNKLPSKEGVVGHGKPPKRPTDLSDEFDNLDDLKNIMERSRRRIEFNRKKLAGKVSTDYRPRVIQTQIKKEQAYLKEYEKYYDHKQRVTPPKGGALVETRMPPGPPNHPTPPRSTPPTYNPELIKDTYNAAGAGRKIKQSKSILPALIVAGLAGATLNKLLPVQARTTNE